MRLTGRSITRKRDQDEQPSAPRTTGQRTTGAPTAYTRLTDVPEITEYAIRHQANLRRVLKARKAGESALDKAIGSTAAGKAMLTERKHLAEMIWQAYQDIGEGRTTRIEMHARHNKRFRAFETKYRALAEDAWLSVAESAPSAYQLYRALRPDNRPPKELELRLLYFFGFVMLQQTVPPADDTASTSQALDAVPALDFSTSSMSLKIEQGHTDVFGFATTSATPASGRYFAFSNVGTAHLIPGAASARALVGTDFTLPPGYTQFSVSADITWSYNMSSWVAFGGAGAGADLVIRVEPSDGSAPVEKYQGLAGVIAPVLWGAGASGSGSSTIATTLTSATSLRGVKVFAGVATHAEAEGAAGNADASGSGTVTRITLHAE
jgi:hypothetical protein